MRFPHIIAFVLYDFDGENAPSIAEGFHVEALVTPLSRPDGVTTIVGQGLLQNLSNEGTFNIVISKGLYFALQSRFNVDNSRTRVDIHNAHNEFNPFDINFAAAPLPKQRANFIDNISLYDGYVTMRKSVSLTQF